MQKLTNSTYYGDKEYISNSMINNFVQYNKYGSRLVTPEKFYAFNVAKTLSWSGNDATLVGTIVDRYFGEGKNILAEYPVVSKRNGENPNEITNSMNEKVQGMIAGLKAFKSFQEFINRPQVISGDSDESIVTAEVQLPTGQAINIKGKMDFIDHKNKQIVDLKTSGSVAMVWDEIQFKGVANINHKYIRQMAMYNKLLPGYSTSLAIADEDGNILWLPIRQDILDKAWANILSDLTLLKEYQNANWENMTTYDPFLPDDAEEGEEF